MPKQTTRLQHNTLTTVSIETVNCSSASSNCKVQFCTYYLIFDFMIFLSLKSQ